MQIIKHAYKKKLPVYTFLFFKFQANLLGNTSYNNVYFFFRDSTLQY